MGLKDWVFKTFVLPRIVKEVDKRMSHFFQKLIGNNLAGILGIVQMLIPLVREFLIYGIRILDIFLTERDLEPLVQKVSTAGASLEEKFTWFKNLFLKTPNE